MASPPAERAGEMLDTLDSIVERNKAVLQEIDERRSDLLDGPSSDHAGSLWKPATIREPAPGEPGPRFPYGRSLHTKLRPAVSVASRRLKRRWRAASALALVAVLAVVLAALVLVPAAVSSGPEKPAANLTALPMSFEANMGQADESVRFLARTGGAASFYFTSSEVVVKLTNPTEATVTVGTNGRPAATSSSIVRVRFRDANPNTIVNSGPALPGRVNYLTGGDPSAWRTGVPTYQSIVYSELYQGVDLRYEGGGNG